jgi:hypothetical protein
MNRGNMIVLKDSIKINASSEKVYEWLIQCLKNKENYQAWHPEHQDIRWIKGQPVQEGSIFYIEEYLHGILHKMRFRIIKIVPNSLIKYRILFPLSIFVPENKFIIEPMGKDGCTFTAMGKINMPYWLFIRMHKSHEQKLEASRQHMKEEGENIKKALEDAN